MGAHRGTTATSSALASVLVLLAGASSAAALASLSACGKDDQAEASDAGDDAAPGPEDATPAPEGAAPAPPDAGVPKRDASGGYCATLTPTPAFCDDFDDGDLENDWNVTNLVPPATSVLELAEDAESAPYALHGRTEATGMGDLANASVRKTIPGGFSHATLSFSMKLASTQVGAGALSIATLDVADRHYFTLNVRDGDPDAPGPSLEETHPSVMTVRKPLAAVPPAGVWTRVVLDLDLAAGKASVSFGTTKVLDAVAIVAEPGTSATVRVGAVYVVGPTPPVDVLVDDVVLVTK